MVVCELNSCTNAWLCLFVFVGYICLLLICIFIFFYILPLPRLLACFPEQTDLCCLTEMFRSILKEMEMLYRCLQCKCQSRDLPLMRQHPCKIENFVLEHLAVLKTLICCFWVSMKMYSEASCRFFTSHAYVCLRTRPTQSICIDREEDATKSSPERESLPALILRFPLFYSHL